MASTAVVSAVGWVVVRPDTAVAQFDIDRGPRQARRVRRRQPSRCRRAPDVPPDGPPCPLGDAAADARGGGQTSPVAVEPWYSLRRHRRRSCSPTSATASPSCAAWPRRPPPGVPASGLFALDIAPFDERRARLRPRRPPLRCRPGGVGRAGRRSAATSWACCVAQRGRPTARCVVLWHRDGLVVGLD